jgi:putative cell wall-binding protein
VRPHSSRWQLPIAAAVAVVATDSQGFPVANYHGTLSVGSTDALAQLPAPIVVSGQSNGLVVGSPLVFGTAGSQSVTVTDGTVHGATSANVVAAGAATHLEVDGPAQVVGGSPFGVDVYALDAHNNVAPSYAGTVRFTATGSGATVPSNVTFTSANRGHLAVAGFSSASLGFRTITATDVAHSSITGTSITDVVTALAVGGSGGTSGGGGTGGGGGGGGAGAGGGVGGTSGTVAAGGTVSSDPAGTILSSTDPLIVSLTSPTAGAVTFTKTDGGTAPTGYTALGFGMTISAPTASASNPLVLVFDIDLAALPSGASPFAVTVFRDGAPIADCTPGTTTASPDPCVAARTVNGTVMTLTVRTSHASTWTFALAKTERLAGSDRYATAAAVSQAQFPPGGASAVVLARGDDYPDALVGAPLAAAKNAPLLLTSGPTLPGVTKMELQRVLPAGATVYVLGGTSAVPSSVGSELTALGYQVVRYSGTDRFGTATAVAAALGNPTTVLLASGLNFPDALAAGPAAAKNHGVVLLTNGTQLPASTSGYLVAHPGTVYAIGGPAATADTKATPIVGADRYATAASVAARFFQSPTDVGIATGSNFPDALAGGAMLAREGAPLLLSSAGVLPAPTTAYLVSVKTMVGSAQLFGGSAVLSAAIMNGTAADLN